MAGVGADASRRTVDQPYASLGVRCYRNPGLALAGLLITTIPDAVRGLSLDDQAMIDAIGNHLLRDHRVGRLPGALCWVWADGHVTWSCECRY